MNLNDYLTKIYQPYGTAIFFNKPFFVASLFSAAGSRKFNPDEYKGGTSPGAYPYKIFNRTKRLQKSLKNTFTKVDINGIEGFFNKYLRNDNVLEIITSKFGIENYAEFNKTCFFRALAMQFELFITSDKDDVEDIVCRKYNDLINQQKFECDTVQRRKMQKSQYRYSLVIYEDDIGIRRSLISQLNEINADESEGYTLDISRANVATDIIRDSRDRDIDGYIIDLSRPLANQQSDIITDYSFSGKDLVDDLLRLKYEQIRMGSYSETAFFIYSSIPAAEVEKMFEFGISSHAQGLSDSKWSKVFNSIKVFALDKRTYTDKAVSRRVKAYFDERYNIDFLKNMEK